MYTSNEFIHQANDKAQLYSETFPARHASCLRFYYHMTGNNGIGFYIYLISVFLQT